MRTGWAAGSLSLNSFEDLESGVMKPQDFALWLAFMQAVGGGVAEFDKIVVESWKLRRDKALSMIGSEFPSPQQIGQVRLVCWLSHTPIVWQHPSDKHVAVQTMPEWLRVYDEDSSEQHDCDARQHLWLYYFRNWFDPTKEPA